MVRGGSFPFFWLRCMCACTQCAHQPLLELRRRQTPSFDSLAPPGVGRVRRWLGRGRGRERPFKKRAKGSVGRSGRPLLLGACVCTNLGGWKKWEGGLVGYNGIAAGRWDGVNATFAPFFSLRG